MARKYDFISELYNRTCKTVVANPASWEAFLRSACYNYRLRFDEQLLVHAQRPDATAVLQIDDWNQKFGRWVNRGAHGIAVFEDETFIGMTVKGAFYSEKADAGNAILEACKAMTNPDPIPLGEYRGFTMELYFEAREYKVRLKGELGYPVTLGTDTFGNITRLDNALEGLPKRLEMNEMELDNLKKQFETAKVDVERPFPQEEELKAKTDRLNELNALLNVDKRENEIVGGEPDEGEEPPEKKPRDLER